VAVDAEELPLLLSSGLLAGRDERQPLDRVRMQKAIFLVTRRGQRAWRELYPYEPYDWGPYSRRLAADLDSLRARGLLRTEPVPGHRYGRYVTTERGERWARQLLAGLSPAEVAFLRAVRKYVTSKSFSNLLREVYAAYPEFATESKFQG
jgi:uncharacterized protein YwgA